MTQQQDIRQRIDKIIAGGQLGINEPWSVLRDARDRIADLESKLTEAWTECRGLQSDADAARPYLRGTLGFIDGLSISHMAKLVAAAYHREIARDGHLCKDIANERQEKEKAKRECADLEQRLESAKEEAAEIECRSLGLEQRLQQAESVGTLRAIARIRELVEDQPGQHMLEALPDLVEAKMAKEAKRDREHYERVIDDMSDAIVKWADDCAELRDKLQQAEQGRDSAEHMATLYADDRNEAQSNNARYREALERLLELCEHANAGAWENGVKDSSETMDEGEFQASEVIDEAREALRHPADGNTEHLREGDAFGMYDALKQIIRDWDGEPGDMEHAKAAVAEWEARPADGQDEKARDVEHHSCHGRVQVIERPSWSADMRWHVIVRVEPEKQVEAWGTTISHAVENVIEHLEADGQADTEKPDEPNDDDYERCPHCTDRYSFVKPKNGVCPWCKLNIHEPKDQQTPAPTYTPPSDAACACSQPMREGDIDNHPNIRRAARRKFGKWNRESLEVLAFEQLQKALKDECACKGERAAINRYVEACDRWESGMDSRCPEDVEEAERDRDESFAELRKLAQQGEGE